MKAAAEIQMIDAMNARTHFGEMLEQTGKDNRRFLISRRGKPAAVVMSVDDYARNIVKDSALLTQIHASAQKANLHEITDSEIDAEIKASRKAAGARRAKSRR